MATKYPELFQALLDPFDASEEKTKAGPKGIRIKYVTSRTVMNRLDEVLGPENWWDEYTNLTDHSAVCCLSIRLPDGTILRKCDAGGSAGMADRGDDEKSIFSDALKRAAAKFGVARYLYRDGTPEFSDLNPHATDPHPNPSPVARQTVPSDCPVSGKDLFRTLKKIEEERNLSLVRPLSDAASKTGINGPMVHWSIAQVEWAWGWVNAHLEDTASHHSNHQPQSQPQTKLGIDNESITKLRGRLYQLASESCRMLDPLAYDKLRLEDQKRQVRAEINGLLSSISPGEVIESMRELNDVEQLNRLIALAHRTLDAREELMRSQISTMEDVSQSGSRVEGTL